jgi:hypothetical protein
MFLIAVIFAIICGTFAKYRSKTKTTLKAQPPEPTEWITIDTDKGNWWDDVHVQD